MMEKETILTPDKALEYGFIDEIAGREADDPLIVPDEPLQNIRKMREKFQKDDFSDTLKEFEELVGENQKDDPEDASMMDAFLIFFHKQEDKNVRKSKQNKTERSNCGITGGYEVRR